MPRKPTNPHRDLQEEFSLYMYLWPDILGRDRSKWERLAELIDSTARRQHKDECCGLAADGYTNMGSPPYETCLYPHATSVERHLLELVLTGIPDFLCENK